MVTVVPDDELKAASCKVAEWCWRAGLAPIFLKGQLDEFPGRDDYERLLSLGTWLEPDPNLVSLVFSPLESAIIPRIQKSLCALQEQLLFDHFVYATLIKEASEQIAQGIEMSGDDIGLVDISTPAFRSEIKAKGLSVNIMPALPGALNSCLPLEEQIFKLLGGSSKIRVRLDAMRLRRIPGAIDILERARTHGRPFNFSWVDALTESTWARFDENPEIQPWIKGLPVEFLWAPRKGGEVHFSCEELRPMEGPSAMSDFVLTRFVHGVYRKGQKLFEHFDGHIHRYTRDNFTTRSALNIADHFVDYEKVKIFCLDGPIAPDTMVDVVASFFRWNDLVPEYFSGNG